MTRSANTTPKKAKATKEAPERSVEPAAVTQQPNVKAKTRKAVAAVRRVPVQYTPRIPGAHCRGC